MTGKRDCTISGSILTVYPSEAVLHINVLKGHTWPITIVDVGRAWAQLNLGHIQAFKSEGRFICLDFLFFKEEQMLRSKAQSRTR